MHRDGDRLDQPALLVAEAVGQRDDLVRAGDPQLLGAARRLESLDFEFVADVVVAAPDGVHSAPTCGMEVTFVPSARPVTPPPTASTEAEYSWPCTTGYLV